jgi:hypothetical protein
VEGSSLAARIKNFIIFFPMVFILAVSAFAENEPVAPTADKSSSMNNDISAQVKALQDEVKRLREEADVRSKLEATVDEKTDQEKRSLRRRVRIIHLPEKVILKSTMVSSMPTTQPIFLKV